MDGRTGPTGWLRAGLARFGHGTVLRVRRREIWVLVFPVELVAADLIGGIAVSSVVSVSLLSCRF